MNSQQAENRQPAPISKKHDSHVAAGIIGNILEWFDYSIYAFFAVAISANFFPADEPIVSLMLSFLVFGLGFVARPLGGFIFGRLGDRLGRKNVLSLTVILMGASTFIMGILPGYQTIGLAAPIILTIVRLGQGISAGGEWGSAVSFLGEYAKPNNRAFIVSFSQVGSALGLLLGSILGLICTRLMSQETLIAWGWRPVFLFGIVIAIFGYFMRRGVEETPVFKDKQEAGNIIKSPLTEAFTKHRKPMLMIFLMTSGAFVTYWLIFSFMTTYVSQFLKLPMSTGFSLTAITLLAYIIALPLVGMLADKFGRRPMLLLGAGGIVLFAYPLFHVLAQTTTFGAMAAVVALLAIIFAMFNGPFTVVMSELFPPSVRVTGVSVPYQLGSAVFAGTAMMMATWFVDKTGNVMAVPIYIICMMAVTLLITIFFYKETKDVDYYNG